jgi:flavin-dependent dehydrogenase
MTAKPMTTRREAPQMVPIVGGSAAGFFTAYLLARRGVPTCVYEQAERLDPKPRTLIVTSRMRDLLGPLGEPSVLNQINRFELFANGRVAEVPLRRPDLIIERASLIRSLAGQAERAGARLSLGRRFQSLETSGRELVLHLDGNGRGSEEIRAQTVIGADGVASRVARTAGWPRLATVPLIQAIVRLPADVPADTVRVWFVPEDTPYFYWLIPESRHQAALGVIGEDGPATFRRLESFLERRQIEPLGFQAARIPLYTGWVPVERQLGPGRVFLVGDAAAQVKVTTVGGIVTGFRGALGVAEAIASGAKGELRSLRRELTMHLLIRRAMHRFSQADYIRLLDLVDGSAREGLSTHSRDEAGRVLWNLCRRQPRLLLWGLRSLLTGGSFHSRNGAGNGRHL